MNEALFFILLLMQAYRLIGIPSRYLVVVISCRDFFGLGIKRVSSKNVHIEYRDQAFKINDNQQKSIEKHF